MRSYLFFRFDKLPLSDLTSEALEKIRQKECISVHIRRGDYLSPEYSDCLGNICTPAYYQKAVEKIKESVSEPYFVVFSDDIAWVKENMPLDPVLYVDWNSGKDSWQDLYLMTQCKHNVMANSTFSWWGAWLNRNPDKIVIAPSRFMTTAPTPDIVPDGWTII